MTSIETTMNNIAGYLEGKNYAFKKVNSKTSKGFVYKVISGDISYTVNIKIDERLGFVVFEAYPGITCKHPALVPMLIKYCQHAAPEVGSLRVGCMFKEVYFRTEAYFADGDVRENTLKLFENCATEVFEAHLPALECISNGRLITDATPIQSGEAHILPDNNENFDKSVDAIREHFLYRGIFNTVAENMDTESPVLFVAEVLDEKSRIKLEVTVNKSRTVIRVKGIPGFESERCNNEYAYMTSRFCNDKSDEKKLGSFFVDSDGGACCFVDFAIADTPITADAMKRATDIIFGMIEEYIDDFRLVSMGIIPDHPRLPGLFHPGLRNLGNMFGRNMMDDIDKKIEALDFKIAGIEDDEDVCGEEADGGTFPDFDEFLTEDGTDDE